jgi:hypothetical protein
MRSRKFKVFLIILSKRGFMKKRAKRRLVQAHYENENGLSVKCGLSLKNRQKEKNLVKEFVAEKLKKSTEEEKISG